MTLSDVTTPNHMGITLLNIAVINGEVLKLAQELHAGGLRIPLKAFLKPNQKGVTSFHMGASFGSFNQIATVLQFSGEHICSEHVMQPDYRGIDAIANAAQAGYLHQILDPKIWAHRNIELIKVLMRAEFEARKYSDISDEIEAKLPSGRSYKINFDKIREETRELSRPTFDKSELLAIGFCRSEKTHAPKDYSKGKV